MRKVIDAAVAHGVAIEINSRYRIPGPAFIRLAKSAGAQFTFGSNGHVKGIGEITWCVETAQNCGLTGKDIWLPAERK